MSSGPRTEGRGEGGGRTRRGPGLAVRVGVRTDGRDCCSFSQKPRLGIWDSTEHVLVDWGWFNIRAIIM